MQTTLIAQDLPDNLGSLRLAIERAVPHGRSPGARDPGAWRKVPDSVDSAWAQLEPEFKALCRDHATLEMRRVSEAAKPSSAKAFKATSKR